MNTYFKMDVKKFLFNNRMKYQCNYLTFITLKDLELIGTGLSESLRMCKTYAKLVETRVTESLRVCQRSRRPMQPFT